MGINKFRYSFYNSLILLTFLFICFFMSAQSRAQSPADELKFHLQNLKTMRADFTQFAVNAEGVKKSAETTGKVMLSRPGKFRWEILQPNKQTIIANDKIIWIYDEDLAQVSKRKVNYNQPGNPAILLSGSIEDMQSLFFISKIPSQMGEWFLLKPKSKNNMYQWIKLHFINGDLVAMLIADSLGQQSEIHFLNIKMNQSLLPALFIFKVPKGVDLVEG